MGATSTHKVHCDNLITTKEEPVQSFTTLDISICDVASNNRMENLFKEVAQMKRQIEITEWAQEHLELLIVISLRFCRGYSVARSCVARLVPKGWILILHACPVTAISSSKRVYRKLEYMAKINK